MSWSVIIVDDEPKVRNGLRDVIPWHDYGYTVQGVFSDGDEALEHLRSHEIDLLVTDIKMPRMNGVDLVRRARDLGRVSHVLILSGYDDFAYLKSAIELNVDSYILKPVNVDEVCSHLGTIEQQLGHEQHSLRLMDAGMDALLNNLFQRLVQGDVRAPELRNKLTFLEQADLLLWDGYCIGAVQLLDTDSGWAHHANARELEYLVRVLRSEIKHTACLFFWDRDRVPMLIGQTEASLAQVIGEVARTVSIETKKGCVCFGGVPVSDLLEIHHGYQTAYEHMFRSRIPKDTASYISYADAVIIAAANDATTIPIGHIDEILHHSDKEALRDLLDSIARDAGDFAKVSRRYFSSVMYIVSLLQKRTKHITSLFDELEVAPGDFSSFATPLSLIAYSRTLCDRIDKLVFRSGVQTSNAIVNDLVRYVHNRYPEGIGLTVYADEVGMNAAYLGHLFRQETGRRFTQYVREVRVQRACDLLTETSFRITEIAGKVGFPDSRYFLRVFREIKGCTPSQYRNLAGN